MNKSKKKIVFAFVGLLCAAAAILVVYYLITQGRLGGVRSGKDSSTEVQKLLEKDLETKYPGTPTEVVKLYWRFNKCIYNTPVSDKQLEELLKQMRIIYDEEMLALDENSWDNMLANVKKDTEEYQKNEQKISAYTVQQNSTVKYNKIDGRECATVITGTNLKRKDKREQTYEKFLCRKDSGGSWRIVGWEQTSNEDEISTLGEK